MTDITQIKTIIFDWIGVLYTRDQSIIPAADELLNQLQNNYQIALMTLAAGGVEARKQAIDGSGLSKYFTVIDIVSRKSSETYLDLAKRLGSSPEQCLVIDDQLPKLERAASIGCHTVWVSGTDRGHLRPTNAGWSPLHTISNITELPDLLAQYQ